MGMARKNGSYFSHLWSAVRSLGQGLKITLRHIRNATKKRRILPITDQRYFLHTEGISTIQYPHEMIAIPDNGRYRLHNEIDDCIVCDKCAKICPVDCIEIEPIRATEEIGKTSDGTSKRIYAAKFDIDMAKCCFCGLCTTVCPTECLTMTKVFDFSVTDIHDHNFAFAEMSPQEIQEKKSILELHQKSKTAATPAPVNEEAKETPEVTRPAAPKPVFRPKIKPPGSQPPTT
jgi:NADH-quinone oxidoreductase subunit I